jgi:phosphatidate cytidylyltransferase
MALNLAVFKTRALSALLFVAIMLTGLLWNYWSFFILFSVIHFGCWIEYQKIMGLIDSGYRQITKFHKYGVMIAGWCFMLYCSDPDYKLGSIVIQQIGFWCGLFFLFVLPILEIVFVHTISFRNIGYSFLGLLYISLSWGLLIFMRSRFNFDLFGSHIDVGLYIVLTIIASIWINDTMAYIIGSLIGKTPLTKISPKKTWEGTVGGIILAVVVMATVGYFFNKEVDWETILMWWVAIAAIASIAGTFGDVLESKLKRMANLKDSGEILPGHGGFLDRFDSLLIATPFVWLYVYIVLMIK